MSGVRSCFLPEVLNEFGVGFEATLVPHNREGTEETTRDVVEGYEGGVSGRGQDNASCLSGAV